MALVLLATAAFADSKREFSGEISKVDRYAKWIIVRGGEPPRRLKFFLARDGQVTSGGQPVAFADLERGARVEIDFTKSGSNQIAHSIALIGAGEAVVAK